MTRKITFSILLIVLFSIGMPLSIFPQVESPSELYRILKAADSLMFDVGYNTGDTNQFVTLLSEDFVFYHDKAGITSSKAEFLAGLRNLRKLSYTPRRKLVANSMKVFPLHKSGVLYGAIQMGEHEFYAIEPGKPEYLTSSAAFTHLWLLENGTWKLSRVYSYDHREPGK